MVILREGTEHMSKGGTSTSSSIDPRVFDLLKENYQHAQGLANQPYQPYSGSLVASPSDATLTGENALLGGAMTAGSAGLRCSGFHRRAGILDGCAGVAGGDLARGHPERLAAIRARPDRQLPQS